MVHRHRLENREKSAKLSSHGRSDSPMHQGTLASTAGSDPGPGTGNRKLPGSLDLARLARYGGRKGPGVIAAVSPEEGARALRTSGLRG